MSIALIGINYRTALINIREKFSFSCHENSVFCKAVLDENHSVHECLLLSTCNRTEILIHFNSIEVSAQDLLIFVKNQLEQFKGIKLPADVNVYMHLEHEAIRHLFRVASGLDSQILGETQILSQVKEAYRISCETKTQGPFLNKAIHLAFKTAKRIHTEVSINEGAVSIGSSAVELLMRVYKKEKVPTVLLIGAGSMAHAVYDSLISKKNIHVKIANRTKENVYKFIKNKDIVVIDIRQIEEIIPKIDVVISAITIEKNLITRTMLEKNIVDNQELICIDISVPRSIDPQCSFVKNVHLYSIDDLKRSISENVNLREQKTVLANQIVEDELDKYMEWEQSLEVTPTIKALKEHVDAIRVDVLKKSKIGNEPISSEQLDFITQKITESICRHAVHKLKENEKDSIHAVRTAYWINVVREAFGFENEK